MRKHYQWLNFALVILCLVMLPGCSDDDENKEDAYELADTYWNENVYRDFEYFWATSIGASSDTLYAYTQDQWENEEFVTRLPFLPVFFTHALPSEKTDFYYEAIRNNSQQFGIGWKDNYPEDSAEWYVYFIEVTNTQLYASEFGENEYYLKYVDLFD